MSDVPEVLPKDAHNAELLANAHPEGWTDPEPAPVYNLVVIGAGTAGLVTASGAAGLGAKVALIERHLMGGDCLNYGCVPSKCIIRSARAAANVRDAHLYGVRVPDGVDYDRRHGVHVDDHLRTTSPRIYAAGDICMRHKFTHAADAAARIVIQNALFLGRKKLSALTVPWCTYTDPEIAHVGMYEGDARERGIAVDTYVRRFEDVDRAIADGEDEGLLKVHVRKGADRILGATLVARHAGELYFADVFAGRRVPERFLDDPILRGECLAGAMYIEDFRRLLGDLGCLDHRVVSKRPVALNSPEIEARIGMIDFYSMTVRAFKLASLEDICEDYGQVATYRGSIPDWPHHFDLDDHHRFFTGKSMLVCGNTAAMLRDTRYGAHFEVAGDRSVHYGPFDCSPAASRTQSPPPQGGACC